MKILFLCVANAVRSQIAEGLAKQLLPDVNVASAGSHPSELNPLAVQVMREIGIDISGQYSKSVDSLSPDFLRELDYVITLCADEVCPIVLSDALKLHWPFPDPVGGGETLEAQLVFFRLVRDGIRQKILDFCGTL